MKYTAVILLDFHTSKNGPAPETVADQIVRDMINIGYTGATLEDVLGPADDPNQLPLWGPDIVSKGEVCE